MAVSKLMGMAVALTLCGCGGGGSSDGGGQAVASFDFSPLTPAQLSAVAQVIKSRDLAPRDVSVVFEDRSNALFVLRIIRHTVNGVPHYGAITVPVVPQTRKLPVVVDLDGMADGNPPYDLRLKLGYMGSELGSAILVSPAFRGRTLQFAGQSWTAGGDFCDGFDGAADDTMALLNVLETLEPVADTSRLLVRGGSRGGGVALLLGERDPRVKLVSAASAPVDFYRRDVAEGYGSSYACQFLNGKTADQSRQLIIASSALHFPMLKSVKKVYLDHGDIDPIVPVLNATEMNKRLVADGVDVDLMIHHGGHDLGFLPAFVDRRFVIFSSLFTQ